MKRLLLGTALAVLLVLPAACSSILDCNEACARVATCGVIPGPFGADQAGCQTQCRQTDNRSAEAVKACIGSSTCTDIAGGKCGTW